MAAETVTAQPQRMESGSEEQGQEQAEDHLCGHEAVKGSSDSSEGREDARTRNGMREPPVAAAELTDHHGQGLGEETALPGDRGARLVDVA